MSADAVRRPTIRDVAARASVSVATASRALNARADVSAGTRERVRAAAADLAFTPRGSRGTQDQALTVGLLTSDSVGRFSIPVMLGAQDALGSGQVAVLLADARGDGIREQYYVRTLLDRRVDGFIVVGETPEARAPITPETPVPVVYAYAPSTDRADASFVPDDAEGAATAVDHLLGLGRTRIAHITGPATSLAAERRARRVEEVLARAGTAVVGGVQYGSDWTQRWGRHATAVLLTRRPEVDAVFCGSDQIAAGVLDVLRDHGRRVPDDVSVVGFDNWDVFARDSRPPLTTVDMDLERLGRAAATHLFGAMGGSVAPGIRRLPCRLVLGESTAPVRTAP